MRVASAFPLVAAAFRQQGRRTPLRCLLMFVALAVPVRAGAQWVRVESPNFVVFGEIGEKRTREYAAEFERFREALGRVLPGAAARTVAPALVFIFKDGRSFAPYRPLYDGKAIELTGYFVGAPDMDVIMLHAGNRERSLYTIYHEYSHLITVNAVHSLPVWLGEGLAEYYSTFELQRNGRRAVLGGVIPAHLARLNMNRLLTIEELLGVEHDSPLYNEGTRRSTFYAQSWALVHMLLNGEPDRTNAFNEYVRLTAAGRSALDAWQEVFGDQKILDDLRRYVRQARMNGYVFEFEREISPAVFQVSIPTAADVNAALGDLLLRVAPERAAAHADTPGEQTPFSAAIRGLIELEKGNERRALDLLVHAARHSGDWLVQYRAATGLERLATLAADAISRPAAAAADAALQRVLADRPDLPHAIALRALIMGPGDAGLAAMKRARELAPERPHYAIWQAQFHSQRGEFVEARRILAPLMSARFPKETRDQARSAMNEAVTQNEARQRAQSQAGGRGGEPRPGPPGVFLPILRELQPGEQRVEAVFERIECPRHGLIVHVRIGQRAARFTAAAFDAVEFLTYREDQAGPVHCGPRPTQDRIYLTFRPSADPNALDGLVIAIEFLPR